MYCNPCGIKTKITGLDRRIIPHTGNPNLDNTTRINMNTVWNERNY
jgi:hypothetical protein